MILEIVAIILALISIILAGLAIYDTRRVNKETSSFLIQIETYSKNINDRAMAWLEQLIFPGRNIVRSSKSNKDDSQTKREKSGEVRDVDLLNFLYTHKAATLEEIMQGLNTDYAIAKSSLIRMRSFLKTYKDIKNRTIYYLAERETEAKKKYPEPLVNTEDIPF
jgi:hypothetical protein